MNQLLFEHQFEEKYGNYYLSIPYIRSSELA